MITNFEAAEDAFDAAERDVVANTGEEPEWHDLVVAVAWECDDATARELCRRKLGYVPRDLEARLGSTDWLA